MSLGSSCGRHLVMLASKIRLGLKRKRRRPPKLTMTTTEATAIMTDSNESKSANGTALAEDRFFPLIRCAENRLNDNQSQMKSTIATTTTSDRQVNDLNNRQQIANRTTRRGSNYRDCLDQIQVTDVARHCSDCKSHCLLSRALMASTTRPKHRNSPLIISPLITKTIVFSIALVLIALLTNTNYLHFSGNINRQLVTRVSCQTSNTYLANNQNQLPPPQADLMESRAELALGPNNLLHKQQQQPNSLAISQLVNFLHSINSNNNNNQNNNNNNNNNINPLQQNLQTIGANGNQRRLPLGTMGNQRASLGQPISSTPVNPFLAAAQFQPTRRQHYQPPPPPPQSNGYNANSNSNNNNFVSSSSPPTLMLNRIANQFGGGSTGGPNGVPPNRFNNGNQLQPLNTIPLGSNSINRAQIMPPPRGGQPMRPFAQSQPGGQQQQQYPSQQQQQPPPTLRSPLMPPPQQQQTATQLMGEPRPIITGFAPSGPPPSSSMNSAISIVQSPPNAIGVPVAVSVPPPQMSSSSSNANQTEPFQAATTTITSRYQPQESSSEINTGSRATTLATAATAPATTTAATTTSTTTTTTAATSGPTLTTSSASSEPSSSTSSDQIVDSIASSESSSPSSSTSGVGVASWNPLNNRTEKPSQGQHLQSTQSSLAPSPDIVTVPPDYNPDQPAPPQNYDIAVSAQMGPSLANDSPRQQQQQPAIEPSATRALSSESPTPSLATLPQPSIAPTETTTIIWSSETQSSSAIQPTRIHTYAGGGSPTSTASVMQTTVLPTTTSTSTSPTASPPPTTAVAPISSSTSQVASPAPAVVPSRIRDSSHVTLVAQNDEPQQQQDAGVVYGKAPSRESKPTRPPPPDQSPSAGRPFIQTAQLDTQVRPYSAGAQSLFKSNHGGASNQQQSHNNKQLPFKPSKPLGPGGGSHDNSSPSGMSVGSGFTIVANGNQTMPTGDIQDYVAGAPPPIVSASQGGGGSANNEPTISAQGGLDPASFDLSAQEASSSAAAARTQQQVVSQPQQPMAPSNGAPSASSSPAPRIRRPTFKPKPAVPPIRIDSCIVGDDSSCDQSHNERCVTEYGISSCHCKPGYARLSQLRGYCSPISLLQLNVKIDKLSDDRRLVFNATLDNPNSEEYQYLEFETIQALASAIQQTGFAKQFMGARVNKFYDRKNKVWANVSLSLEANNVTKSERVQQVVGQELAKLVQLKQRQPFGESTLVLDGSKESISKLVDVNECASKELNDCSIHATCTNDFGGFSCQCLPGFEDKYLQQHKQQQQQQQSSASGDNGGVDKNKLGRTCMGCSPAYCSNRGECSVVDGKKQCKCRPNFMGARCDIDSEVLFVAIGGSLVGLIILIITFWCLFVFNRRWRREQQKMDAMSATSGLTYNYVNSPSNSSNSLMSPARAAVASGPLGRSSGAYAAMGQRFSVGGGGGGIGLMSSRHHGQFGGAPDQQAIMESTSSSSSAASQPIACNPYAAGYQYEDAGLLIAPASTGGSSEQTSPGGNSYQGAGHGHSNHSAAFLAATAAGNAYTLSGHHHHHNYLSHHHHLQQQQQQQQQPMHHYQSHTHLHHTGGKQHHQQQQQQLVSQFHPALDYMRTLNATATTGNYQQHQPNGYDTRWRTLQDNNKQQSLAGYYLAR